MKIINSKKSQIKNENIKYFVDQITKKYIGFAGTVSVYDINVYVDTRDGTGYEEVIEKLKPLVYKLSNKYHFNGNTLEDTRQDIIVHILEGIPKYDPRKNTKLSTFVEMRVNRRLINEIRNRGRISKNATYLNVGVFNITCECGYSFITRVGNNSDCDCVNCGQSINNAKKKMPISTPEINESLLSLEDTSNSYFDNQNKIIQNNINSMDDYVIFMHDMKNWLQDEDPRVIKIIELIYFHDYSIKSAAEQVGLSGAGANMKLKELSQNNNVKALFGR